MKQPRAVRKSARRECLKLDRDLALTSGEKRAAIGLSLLSEC
jgi:hypothetical protein